MTTADDWQRLGELVVQARVARGMDTREQLATVAGFSSRLLADIEKGRRTNYERPYLIKLERALGWATGSVDDILDGGEPTLVSTAAADTLDDDIELEIQLIQSSGLPEAQVKAMVAAAREQQRRNREALARLREQQRAQLRATLQALLDVARGGAQPAN